MAHLTRNLPAHYDVLAEAVSADGRIVKRVEARADSLADVAEAFKLAAAEARIAGVKPARIRLTASRAGVTEIAVTEELDLSFPSDTVAAVLAQSALLDGKTKLDTVSRPVPTMDHTRDALVSPPGHVRPAQAIVRWTPQEILEEAARQAPDLLPFTAAGDQLVCRLGSVPLYALQGSRCTNWGQYQGQSLADVITQRIRWLRYPASKWSTP